MRLNVSSLTRTQNNNFCESSPNKGVGAKRTRAYFIRHLTAMPRSSNPAQ